MTDPATTRSTKQPLVILLAAVLIIAYLGAGFNFFVEYHNFHQLQQQKNEQIAESKIIDQKLCTTLSKLHSDAPPPGNSASNPSRVYLQIQHEQLGELFHDINC